MQTIEEMYIFITIFILGIIFAIILFIFLHKKRKKDFGTLKNFLNGRFEYDSTLYKFIGDFKGVPLTISQICAGGSNSSTPNTIWINLQTNSPLNLEIKSSYYLDSLGEKLGLLNEDSKSGDAEFDKLFHVNSADTRSTSFLYSSENRQLIQDIFKLEVKTFLNAEYIEYLSISKGHIELRKTYTNLKNELSQDKVMHILKTLHKLGAN